MGVVSLGTTVLHGRQVCGSTRETYRDTLDTAMLIVKSTEKAARVISCFADSLVRVKWPFRSSK